MDLHETALDGGTVARIEQNNWVSEIRLSAKSLGVDSHKAKLLPNFVEQNIDSQIHLHRNAAVLRVLHQFVDIFNRDRINLIVNINAPSVFSVALNAINQLINIVIAVELDFSVVDSVLCKNLAHHLFIDFGQRSMRGEEKTTRLLGLDDNIRLFLVHADASGLNFSGEFSFLLFALLSVENHQNQVR